MEADAWSHLSASSRRHERVLQSRFDLYAGFEEAEGGEDDQRVEFPCPFCSEEFDMVGLCCHIDDEHPVEAQNGVCPFCEARVGMDMLGHIMMQHENFFKIHRRRRLRKGSSMSHSMLSLLKKELREGHLQSLPGSSSFTVPASSAAPDPLLSSFIYNLPISNPLKDIQPQTSDEGSAISSVLDNKIIESAELPLCAEDQEKGRRSEFVRELVLSTVFKDML